MMSYYEYASRDRISQETTEFFLVVGELAIVSIDAFHAHNNVLNHVIAPHQQESGGANILFLSVSGCKAWSDLQRRRSK